MSSALVTHTKNTIDRDRLRGIFITHGHEDHIGALPHVLQKIQAPIYATRMSAGPIKLKLEEHQLASSITLVECAAGEVIKGFREITERAAFRGTFCLLGRL